MSDINIGAISEALNNKVDLPTPNTPQDAVDYVVEKQDPTADNGYTWFRKYKSGWVEQGGRGQTNITVTLPIAMSYSNYVVLVENHVRVNGGTGASDMTTTSFIPRWQQHNANSWGANNFAVSWQVSGMSEQ